VIKPLLETLNATLMLLIHPLLLSKQLANDE
jgi:hypothetical protein